MKEIKHHAVLYFGSDSNSSRFTNEQNQVIKTQLIHLKASFSEDARLLFQDHSLGFATHVSNQIVENCESLKTGEDAFEQVDVWNTSEILTIFANVEEYQETWSSFSPALYSSSFEKKDTLK